MDKMVFQMVKNGKDINEVLEMPYAYVVDIMRDSKKPQKKKSLIDAFSR